VKAPAWRELLAYAPPPDRLAGRVLLVTGAARGLGRAVARSLAAHGAGVVLLDKDRAGLETLYDEIVADAGPEPALYPMDLRGATPDDHADVAARVGDALGRLDGLVHVAGVLGTLTSIESYDPLAWAEVFQVNVHAPFLLTRACLPLLRAAPDASVVFTSAAAGRRGRAYWGAYAASLHALEGLARVLADELETTAPVRVNSLDPGPVRTSLRAAAYPSENPAGVPAPEALTGPYLFLSGPDARGLSGAALGPPPDAPGTGPDPGPGPCPDPCPDP